MKLSKRTKIGLGFAALIVIIFVVIVIIISLSTLPSCEGVVCPEAGNPCKVAGECQASTGECSAETDVDDNTSCGFEDGEPLICRSGVCVPTPGICDCKTLWPSGNCKGFKSPNIPRRRDFCTSQTTEAGCNRVPSHDPGTCQWIG